METPNAPSEWRSTRRPLQRKYKAASPGSSPVRPLNVRTPSSAPGVTYNKTAWHVLSKCSNTAPTPALAKLRNQYYAYITTLQKYHGYRGRGTITARPKHGLNHTRATDFLIFSYFQDSILRKARSVVQLPHKRCKNQGSRQAMPHYGTPRWSLSRAVYLFRILFRSLPLERICYILQPFAYRIICIVPLSLQPSLINNA